MDFKKYRHDAPYPIKSNFTTHYWHKSGKLVYSCTDNDNLKHLREKYADCTYAGELNVEMFHKAADKFQEAEHNAYEAFKNDLFEELNITTNPNRFKLFEKAWDRGNRSLRSVLEEARDLVDLII